MKPIITALLCLLSTTLIADSQNKLPEGFVYIKDEIPNIVEEIRYLHNGEKKHAHKCGSCCILVPLSLFAKEFCVQILQTKREREN